MVENQMNIWPSFEVILYCARMHSLKEDFNIKADFENKVSYQFHGEHFTAGRNSASIYTLVLAMQRNEDQNAYIQIQNEVMPIDQYRLVLHTSKALRNYFQSTIHVEEREQNHRLTDHSGKGHQFLFDVQFSKSSDKEPPGKNSSNE